MPLRGGYPSQLTASEKDVADPQWSPDGRRLAYIRDRELRVVDADGRRDIVVTAATGVALPRWSPDGHRLAFVSRRRGWSQVWLVDAPVPRRGRPARDPSRRRRHPLTPTGIDIDDLVWSPTAGRSRSSRSGRRSTPRPRSTSSTSPPAPSAGSPAGEGVGVGAAADARRRTALRHRCRRLVPGRATRRRRQGAARADNRAREHGEPPAGSAGRRCRHPTAGGSPMSRSTTGSSTWSSRRSRVSFRRSAAAAGRPRTDPRSSPRRGAGRQPVVRRLACVRLDVGWGVGRRRWRERDRGAGPVAAAGSGRRPGRIGPRQVTTSMPAVLASAFAEGRAARASGSR